MGVPMRSQTGGVDERVTLSTGESVPLPFPFETTMTGAVFAAPRDRVRALLPAGFELTPIRATPRSAAVTFVSVENHEVGGGLVEPYSECGIGIPAVRGPSSPPPFASVFTHAVNSYVWFLPVTTEAARTLGAELWGLPKKVLEITHTDAGSTRRTTVGDDNGRLLTLEVERPRTVRRRDSGYNYTVTDGALRRIPAEFDGRIGLWPFTRRAAVSLGGHPRAGPLRDLGLGGRALLRFAVEGEVAFYPAETVYDPGGPGSGAP